MKNGLYYLEVIVKGSLGYYCTEYISIIETYFVYKTEMGIIVLNNNYEDLEVYDDVKSFKQSMGYENSDFDTYCHMVKL